MYTLNGKIIDASLVRDNKERNDDSLKLYIQIKLEKNSEKKYDIFYVWDISNSSNFKKAVQLLKYGNAYKFDQLKGKIIRVAYVEDRHYAIGDPIEDSFITLTGLFKIHTFKDLELEFKGFQD